MAWSGGWASVAVVVFGLALGSRYRVPALIATSFALAVIVGLSAAWLGWPFALATQRALVLLVALQGAYVAGLALRLALAAAMARKQAGSAERARQITPKLGC